MTDKNLRKPERVEEYMSIDTEDTIAAIASAAGGAHRGIIRVTGPKCLDVVGRIFERAEGETTPVHLSRHPSLVEGHIELAPLETSLSATLYLWPGNRSYTRQPTAELHTVGSPPLLEAVLAEVCRQGARLARPGEFTLRAFLAGRLDLTQAEAVLGVIDADSERQLKTALSQLAGGIAGPLGEIRNQLLDLLSHLEAGLDFVDEDIEFISREKLLEVLEQAVSQIEGIARQMQSRGAAISLPRVVLCGLPNAGKSSLLNVLAGEDAALVSSEAGTTRDFVSRRVCFDGVELELVDTAGISDSSTAHIEKAAQQLAREQTDNCQLRLWCVDATNLVAQPKLPADNAATPQFLVVTKCDLVADSAAPGSILTSSRSGAGISELRRRIAAELASQPGDAVASTAARCQESLTLASSTLHRALAEGEQGAGEELIAAELRAALDDLGRVLGSVYTENILDRIFSRFCIGK